VAPSLADSANAAWVERTWARAAEEIAQGHRVYVVCPRIDASDEVTDAEEEGARPLASVEEVAAYLRSHPALSGIAIHELTGRTPSPVKAQIMEDFSAGRAPLLVATTVIEVGVNVPNASVMVIESAERFGLSQLHQLRGRVGRGAEQSYCILVTGYKLSEVTRKRLGIIVSTSDGFRIAEEDLKLRGAGDMEGTQQSGDGLSLRIADLAQDGGILRTARDVASRILDADPNLTSPENALLNARLNALFRQRMNWGLIS